MSMSKETANNDRHTDCNGHITGYGATQPNLGRFEHLTRGGIRDDYIVVHLSFLVELRLNIDCEEL
jgi:hypothetical protein